MGPKVAFVVLSAFPLWAVAQSTLEWPNAPVRAVPWLPKAPLALFVLHSALAPNEGEYKCAFSFIIAQVLFSKPPSKRKFKPQSQRLKYKAKDLGSPYP